MNNLNKIFLVIILLCITFSFIKKNDDFIDENVETNIITQETNTKIKNFGATFEKLGSDIIKSSFNIEPEIYTSKEIRAFLEKQNINKITLYDKKYYLTDWETWKRIIEIDYLNEKKYVVNIFDCDNYSFLFSSRMSYLFNLNSSGIAFGKRIDITTNKINNHSFNLILTYDKNKELELFLYEPINDKWIKYNKNSILDNKKYKINSVIYF